MPASIRHLTDKKLNLSSLLALWKDGLYYKAAVVQCDKSKKRCLVCFEDGSEIWLNNRDVHLQLSLDQLNEDEDIVCCVCDDGNSEAPNEIILCDVCNQGYHQKCHNPPVDSSKIDESEDATDHKDWFCATCSYILNQSNREKLSASAIQQQQSKQSPPKSQPQRAQTSQTSTPQPSQPKTMVQSNSQVQSRPGPLAKQAEQLQQRETQSQQMIPVKRSPVNMDLVDATTSSAGQTKQLQQPQVPKDQQQHQSQQSVQGPQNKMSSANGPANVPAKSPVKVKQTPTIAQQAAKQRVTTTIGPVRTVPDVRQAPYPAANRVRVGASSSSATLATMTASSALIVGGASAGRTKQDLVNQSNNRSIVQRQRAQASSEQTTGAAIASANNQASPVKHAVRKSSVNYNPVSPVRQSALPTATRSILPVSQGPVNSAPVIVTTPSPSVVTPPKVTPGTLGTPMFGNRLIPPTPQYMINATSLSPLHGASMSTRLVVPRVNNEPPQQSADSPVNVSVGNTQNHTNLTATSKLVVADSMLSDGAHRQQPMVNNSNNDNNGSSNNNSEDNIGNNNKNNVAPAASSS